MKTTLTNDELQKIISDAIISVLEKVKIINVKGGFEIKKKTGVSRDVVLNDPRYKHTRKATEEFLTASKSEKTLRHAILPLLEHAKNNKTVNRTFSAMHKIIMADEINDKGKRNAAHGPTHKLKGFDFNYHSSLWSVLFVRFMFEFDRPSGKIKLNLPTFIPIESIVSFKSATHFKLVSCGSEIDFLNRTSNSDIQETNYIPINYDLTGDILLEHKVPPGSEHPLFLFLAVQFYQLVNGIQYRLRDKTKNPVAIVAVDKIGFEIPPGFT